jgi:hypothetical protein
MTITLRGKDVANNKSLDVIKSAVIKGALNNIIAAPVSLVRLDH